MFHQIYRTTLIGLSLTSSLAWATCPDEGVLETVKSIEAQEQFAFKPADWPDEVWEEQLAHLKQMIDRANIPFTRAGDGQWLITGHMFSEPRTVDLLHTVAVFGTENHPSTLQSQHVQRVLSRLIADNNLNALQKEVLKTELLRIYDDIPADRASPPSSIAYANSIARAELQRAQILRMEIYGTFKVLGLGDTDDSRFEDVELKYGSITTESWKEILSARLQE